MSDRPSDRAIAQAFWEASSRLDCGEEPINVSISGVTKRAREIEAAEPEGDIFDAYKTWPEDVKAKLSAHDLRRMGGWSPKTSVGEWRIDTSAGGPILVYKDCSVIEGEDARHVLYLIARDAAAPEGAQPAARVTMTHYSTTGREGMVKWLGDDGDPIPVARGALLYTAPPSLGGEDAALRRDAERWRFVREQDGVTIHVEEPDDDGDLAFVCGHSPEELDAAIDAARAAEGGES